MSDIDLKLSQLVLLADTTSITRQGILLTRHGTGKEYSRKDIPGIFVRQNLKQQQQQNRKSLQNLAEFWFILTRGLCIGPC